MKNQYIQLFFLTAMVLLSACEKESEPMPEVEPLEILHLSHTRSNDEGVVPDLVADLDLTRYDLLCLGGDLDANTSTSDAVMDTWDQLFDLGSPATLWSLGNHDVSDRERIQQYTHRPSFYTYTTHRLAFLVLDTELNASNMVGDQLDLIHSVCDTLSEVAALVVLSHKLIWMPGHDELESQIDDVANGPFGTCGYCTQPNNFYDEVYPQFLEVANRGIQVFCIGGDIGVKNKGFTFQTSEGIAYLASGIQFSHEGNQALRLRYHPDVDQLEWWFVALEDI